MQSEFAYCYVSLYMYNIIWYGYLYIPGNFYCSSDSEERILLNDPSLLPSQILERKVEDVVGKYTYLSVKYADPSSKYNDLSTKNNDQSAKYSDPSIKFNELSANTTFCWLKLTFCTRHIIDCQVASTGLYKFFLYRLALQHLVLKCIKMMVVIQNKAYCMHPDYACKRFSRNYSEVHSLINICSWWSIRAMGKKGLSGNNTEVVY